MNSISTSLVLHQLGKVIFGSSDNRAIEEEKQNRQKALRQISSVCKNASPDKIEQAIELYNKKHAVLKDPFCNFFFIGGFKFKTNNAKDTIDRYSVGFYELLRIGASLTQLQNWTQGVCYLEKSFLPTDEFTKGYIELVKAGATDKELKLYRKAVTYFLNTYGEKFSPDEMINTFVEAVQRDDMSEEYRLNLLRTEVTKTFDAWLIKYTKRAITVANVAKVGFIGGALYNIINAL